MRQRKETPPEGHVSLRVRFVNTPEVTIDLVRGRASPNADSRTDGQVARRREKGGGRRRASPPPDGAKGAVYTDLHGPHPGWVEWAA